MTLESIFEMTNILKANQNNVKRLEVYRLLIEHAYLDKANVAPIRELQKLTTWLL
jgi:hypothetical protein